MQHPQGKHSRIQFDGRDQNRRYHHLKRQRKAAQPGVFQHSDSCKGQSSGNTHQAEAVTAVGDFDGNINAVAQKKKQQILLRFHSFFSHSN